MFVSFVNLFATKHNSIHHKNRRELTVKNLLTISTVAVLLFAGAAFGQQKRMTPSQAQDCIKEGNAFAKLQSADP